MCFLFFIRPSYYCLPTPPSEFLSFLSKEIQIDYLLRGTTLTFPSFSSFFVFHHMLFFFFFSFLFLSSILFFYRSLYACTKYYWTIFGVCPVFACLFPESLRTRGFGCLCRIFVFLLSGPVRCAIFYVARC